MFGCCRRGDAANFGEEAGQQLQVVLEGVGQHLEGDHPAQEQMFGLVDDAHAAGPPAFEDAVVAEDHAGGLAALDAIGLERREQFLLDQLQQQPFVVRLSSHFFAGAGGQCFPVLAQDHGAAQHVLQHELRGGRDAQWGPRSSRSRCRALGRERSWVVSSGRGDGAKELPLTGVPLSSFLLKYIASGGGMHPCLLRPDLFSRDAESSERSVSRAERLRSEDSASRLHGGGPDHGTRIPLPPAVRLAS